MRQDWELTPESRGQDETCIAGISVFNYVSSKLYDAAEGKDVSDVKIASKSKKLT